MLRSLLVTCSFAFIAATAKAHEFWIDPVQHQVEIGETVFADIRVGEEYEGGAFPFIPRNFRRFETSMSGTLTPVSGTVGDRPALAVTPAGEGLMVAIHVTTDQNLTWSEWDKFVSFLNHKDLAWGLAEHEARGLSKTNARERYSRYAKSLIAVGDGAGSDIEAGLLIEIVALENPYTDDLSDGLDVRVMYDGAPFGDAQIEVFEKSADGEVRVFTDRTDANGFATIPVKPGHRYMLDAVALRPLEVVEERDPAWESLWANLTFETP